MLRGGVRRVFIRCPPLGGPSSPAKRCPRPLFCGTVVGKALVLAVVLAPSRTLGAEAFAPLRVKNLTPPHLVFLQPSAELPVTGSGGSIDFAYGTVFVAEEGEGAQALLDMEVARFALTGALETPWGAILSVEIPFLWFGGGAFDSALHGYHGAFGLPDGGRSKRPENAFSYRVRRGAREYSPDPPASGGLGDVVLGAASPLRSPRSSELQSAVRWSLKLPTGSARDGFGSGSADAGVGLLGFWGGPRAGLTANLDLIYLGGTPDPVLRLGNPWMLSSLVSLGLDLGILGTASAQIRFVTSPYDTGIRPLDRPVLLLGAGLRRQITSRLWASLGFTEDLVVESSPDFSLMGSVEW